MVKDLLILMGVWPHLMTEEFFVSTEQGRVKPKPLTLRKYTHTRTESIQKHCRKIKACEIARPSHSVIPVVS